ncbi:MAG: RNA polymerase sigma factor [Planctomycetota bacterium]|jgi:RNA polymerase sigma-70 factor (ECF subfamily)
MSTREQLIEQVLVLRCQIGDREALAELIARYEKPVRYFVSRLLQDPEKTEDLVQDIWLAVVRKICTLKKAEAFSMWLYRIARNRVYKELRRKRQFTELDENIEAANSDEDSVFSVEDAARVHRCLERLRSEHKEVLLLRFLEQMSYEQISQVIGCKVGTVRSRIYYAKRALKQEMET